MLVTGPDQLRLRRRAIARGPLGPGGDQARPAPASTRTATAA
jgi:hypothetical protein